ncbi:MAG: glycosidase [Sphingobium sp. 32-64-5]|nr:MAG: glycosidase [Sphingobium sp. 32-64-5]
MTGAAAPPAAAAPIADLTTVELVWIEKQTEHWIRFGREVREQILDRRRRILFFAPDTIFVLVRWAANEHGTVLSRLDILRAARRGEPCQSVPTVTPGGDILLRVDGWPKVARMLERIDAIEADGIDPAEVSPDHWRHVHNRLAAGETPRRYSPERHRAFLLARRTGA